MTETYPDLNSFIAALADKAEAFRQSLIPMSDEARLKHAMRLVQTSTMVFGVWPDAEEAGGVGVQIIKGKDVLVPLDCFEMPDGITIAAIQCVGYEQAAAARDAWGGYEQHWNQYRQRGRLPLQTHRLGCGAPFSTLTTRRSAFRDSADVGRA
jgi:hypothetical protein